jgi:membrane protease YdiL (CAAX protease family)
VVTISDNPTPSSSKPPPAPTACPSGQPDPLDGASGGDPAPQSAPDAGKPATSRRSPARPLALFAVLVFALEVIVFVAPLSREVRPFALMLIPAAAALIGSARSGGAPAVRSLLGRLVVWRVRPRWYAAAILIPVAEKIIVAGLLLGQTTSQRLVSSLSIAALIVPLVVLIPGLLEELGWRGYGVQTALDGGRSIAWATLVVGCLFFLIHVPLYLPGNLYHGLPFWPLPLTLMSSSVFLTWIYLRTGSVLLTGLMHASFSASVPFTWGLDPTWVWQARAVILTILAIALITSSQLRTTVDTGVGRGHRDHALDR